MNNHGHRFEFRSRSQNQPLADLTNNNHQHYARELRSHVNATLINNSPPSPPPPPHHSTDNNNNIESDTDTGSERTSWKTNPKVLAKLEEFYTKHEYCSHVDRMYLIDKYDIMNSEIIDWFAVRKSKDNNKKSSYVLYINVPCPFWKYMKNLEIFVNFFKV